MSETLYTKTVTVKMQPDQAEKLKAIAKANQTSQGSIVRQWIEKEYKSLKKSDPDLYDGLFLEMYQTE